MSGGLREALGLPPVKITAKSTQAATFGQMFRGRIAKVNGKLQLTAVQADPTEHAPLSDQKLKLMEAFQKASEQIDPNNPAVADPAIQRVMAAVVAVDGKAAALAKEVNVGREQWLEREAEFDDVMLIIGELEDAKHPKATSLRRVGESIRKQAKNRKFQEATGALDQLRPKLNQILNEQKSLADPAAGEQKGIGVPTPIGPVDIPIDIVTDIAKTLFGPRTANCEVQNFSDQTLQFIASSVKHDWGDFKTFPPDFIPPNNKGNFLTENNSPFTGTEGELRFRIDEQGTTWLVRWNNPRAGDNTAKTQIDGPNKEKYEQPIALAGKGGEANFRFTLKKKGAVGPGPGPGPGPSGPDAASGCHVTITNNTKVTLTLGGQGHERGDFMTFPATTLAPGASTNFVSVETPNSKDPKDEGCKGFLLWQVGTPDVLWRVEWDNPEGAKNVASASFNPPNGPFTSLNQIGQGEENVPTAFTISGDGGGVVPPVGKREGLTVLVRDKKTGTGIEAASVKVGDQTDTTSKIGLATVELPIGKHAFEASAKGYSKETGSVDIVEGDNPELVIELSKDGNEKLAAIGVLVIDEKTGEVIAGADVKLGEDAEKTSENGLAVFSIDPGSYSYDVSAQDYEPAKGTVEVKEGDDNELVVPLTKKDTGKKTKLTFLVTDEAGQPIEGASVSVSADQTGKTDKNGNVDFDVEAGNVPFMVEKEGFESKEDTVDIEEGSHEIVPVILKKGDKVAFDPPPESKQPTLKKGAKSADGWVEYLQKLLNKHLGDGTVAVDGDFGGKTYEAVKKFQASTTPPCLIDGVVGNETWSMLRKGEREAVGVTKKPDEKGQEARWATEKNDFVTYDVASDEIRMSAFSVGDEQLAKNTTVTVRMSSEDGATQETFTAPVGDPVGPAPTGSGHEYIVKVGKVAARFGKGQVKVETYFAQDLGGDLWSGTVDTTKNSGGGDGGNKGGGGGGGNKGGGNKGGGNKGGGNKGGGGGKKGGGDKPPVGSGTSLDVTVVWKGPDKPKSLAGFRVMHNASGQMDITDEKGKVLLQDIIPTKGASKLFAINDDLGAAGYTSVILEPGKTVPVKIEVEPIDSEAGDIDVTVEWDGDGDAPDNMGGYRVYHYASAKSGITDKSGKVTLTGVPAGLGSSKLIAIHKDEKSGGGAEVEVIAGETAEVTIPVKENNDPDEETAEVTIQVLDSVTRKSVDTATIRIADEVVEENSLTIQHVAVGEQPYKVTAPGYKTQTGTVNVESGVGAYQLIELVSTGGGGGEGGDTPEPENEANSVQISVIDRVTEEPISGATVKIDGKVATPRFSIVPVYVVSAGEHTYEVSAKGYETGKGKFTATAVAIKQVVVKLKPQGGP